MAPAPAVEQKTYDAPKSLHGFELVRDEFVAEYDSRVLTYKHQKTGERDVVNGACARAIGRMILQVRQQLKIYVLVQAARSCLLSIVTRTRHSAWYCARR